MMLYVATVLASSIVGALTMRGAAAALRLRARFVVGFGPRWSKKEPRWIEMRVLPFWLWTSLIDAHGGRALLARASAPIAMLVVPFAVLVISLMTVGYEAYDYGPPLIAGVIVPDSPAERAEMYAGDRLISANGTPIGTLDSLRAVLADRADQPTRILVERDGRRLYLIVVPVREQGRAIIGVGPHMTRERPGFQAAVVVATMGVLGWGRQWAALFSNPAPDQIISVVGMSGARITLEQIFYSVLVMWMGVSIFFAALTTFAQIAGAIRARLARAALDSAI